MSRHVWTPEQVAELRRRYPDERAEDIAVDLGLDVGRVYGKAHRLGLEKSAAFQASPASGRTYDGRGAANRFKPGQTSLTKGKKMGTRGRSGETQFQKGNVTGNAAVVVKPIGYECMRDGYLVRKVNNDLPFYKRWRAVHQIEWEAVNGPVPSGHALCFKNGNRLDIRLENLELVTRRELARRNTIHRFPAEVKECMRLVGRIKREVRKKQETTNG